MASFIWNRDPIEAYENPYEYEAQDQFAREADMLLDLIFTNLMERSGKYGRDDCSAEKAVWMLSVDALETLKDCLQLLREKRHRVASRLFRDALEAIELASFFSTDDARVPRYLKCWYEDEVVPNRHFRDYLKRSVSIEEFERAKRYYSMLSKLNHRTYRSLAYSYVLGKGNRLIYEGEFRRPASPAPHPVSMFYALLANLIKYFMERLVACDVVSPEKAGEYWASAFEEKPVQRKFTTPKQEYERFSKE